MNLRSQNFLRNTNRPAFVSLFAGIISVLPYILLVGSWSMRYSLATFSMSLDVSEILGSVIDNVSTIIFSLVSSFVFGGIGLVSGNVGLKQIKNNESLEKGYTLIQAGMTLAGLSVIGSAIIGIFFLIFFAFLFVTTPA